MTLSAFALELVEILLPVIALFLVALIGNGVALLRKKIEGIDNEIARQSLSTALTEAESVGIDAVRATNQVLVNELRAKSEDGKLTEDEAKEAMGVAKDYFLGHITSGSLEILEASLGPVQEWLEGFIEAKLSAEKRGLISPVH
ncbi:MAG: hypothetical protein GX872_06325 [Firmicutes bacterium]|nr:hypothetical protein [Bacillota bacterium]